jgi:hypothetical protein
VIALTASSSSNNVFDQPGTLGFLIVFGMGVLLYFLFRSMTKHLRKVREAARAEAAQADAEAVRQTHSAGNGAPPAG